MSTSIHVFQSNKAAVAPRQLSYWAVVSVIMRYEFGTRENVSQRSVHRLRYAALLARQCHIGVTVSGGRVFRNQRKAEARLMAEVLQKEFNVTVVWRENQSRNTAENAEYTAALLQQNGVEHALLVTSAYHMPRAIYAFSHYGIGITPAPTAFIGRSKGPVLKWLPSAAALAQSQLALHEYLGLLVYKLTYALR